MTKSPRNKLIVPVTDSGSNPDASPSPVVTPVAVVTPPGRIYTCLLCSVVGTKQTPLIAVMFTSPVRMEVATMIALTRTACDLVLESVGFSKPDHPRTARFQLCIVQKDMCPKPYAGPILPPSLQSKTKDGLVVQDCLQSLVNYAESGACRDGVRGRAH